MDDQQITPANNTALIIVIALVIIGIIILLVVLFNSKDNSSGDNNDDDEEDNGDAVDTNPVIPGIRPRPRPVRPVPNNPNVPVPVPIPTPQVIAPGNIQKDVSSDLHLSSSSGEVLVNSNLSSDHVILPNKHQGVVLVTDNFSEGEIEEEEDIFNLDEDLAPVEEVGVIPLPSSNPIVTDLSSRDGKNETAGISVSNPSENPADFSSNFSSQTGSEPARPKPKKKSRLDEMIEEAQKNNTANKPRMGPFNK